MREDRVFNFSAGPGVLAEEVLQKAQDEIFNYRYLNLCHSLEVISTPLYNYNVETTGLTYRKRMPIEDLALADHIISASRQLNCDGRFLQIQYRRYD